MNANRDPKRRAFTLIELMVVVTIIAILAALIVPAVQRITARAMALKCLATAKSIATSVRTYASSWDGWTNPDPEYYVKLMDFRIDIPSSAGTGYETFGYLNNEGAGWATDTSSQSYQYAQTLNGLICPVDDSPQTTKHAIRSSYAVTSFFTGSSLMTETLAANEMLAVNEVGKRHPSEDDGEIDGHYVYADLHATLGYQGPALRGSKMRVWHRNTDSGIRGVAESALPAPEYEELFASKWSLPMDWSWGRVEGLLGTTGTNDWYPAPRGGGPSNGRRQYPRFVTMRLDGILHLPDSGTYEFCVWGSDRAGWFGLGEAFEAPKDAVDAGDFTWRFRQDWWGPNYTRTNATLVQTIDRERWYPIQLMHWGSDYIGSVAVSLRRQDGNGGYDSNYGGATGTLLSNEWIFRLP